MSYIDKNFQYNIGDDNKLIKEINKTLMSFAKNGNVNSLYELLRNFFSLERFRGKSGDKKINFLELDIKMTTLKTFGEIINYLDKDEDINVTDTTDIFHFIFKILIERFEKINLDSTPKILYLTDVTWIILKWVGLHHKCFDNLQFLLLIIINGITRFDYIVRDCRGVDIQTNEICSYTCGRAIHPILINEGEVKNPRIVIYNTEGEYSDFMDNVHILKYMQGGELLHPADELRRVRYKKKYLKYKTKYLLLKNKIKN